MGEERRFQVSIDFGEVIKQLRDTIYLRREDALLELVQNADDAIILRQTRGPLPGSNPGRIVIKAAQMEKELSVEDNGTGIAEDEFVVFLSSLPAARRRLEAFGEKELAARQWGGGFISVFLLADRAEFSSQSAAPRAQLLVASLDATGSATLSTGERAGEPGTKMRLHLREDCSYLLERPALEQFVRTHCTYIKSPIYLNDDTDPVHDGERRAPVKTQTEDDELLNNVDAALRSARLQFDRNASIGGLRPDFIVYGPKGQTIIVEAKSWSADTGTLRRAIDQMNRYRSATGVDSVLMVLGDSGELPGGSGIVAVDGLVDAIQSELLRPVAEAARPKPVSVPRQTIFAAMPFSGEYDDVFFVAMAYAAEKNGATCVRVDKEEFSGDVIDKIRSLIRQSSAIICDLSEARPNVLYETGFAHALEKPTIHICSTPLSELPFDVRNWNTLAYAHGRTVHLREALAARLNALLM
jgi:hypothetical protein